MKISSKDIVVDGFAFNDTLERKIWDNNDEMNPEIREVLLKIASDFVDGLTIDINLEDVRLTGSLANYSWSKYSDVDLHLIVNFKTVDEDLDLVKGYFNSASALWNLKHDIKIKGYDVEIYVEDSGEEHVSTGLYSILDNDWLRLPPDEQSDEISFDDVKKKVAGIMYQVHELEKLDKGLTQTITLVDKIKEKIRKMRKTGLRTKKGQYSTGNIAFKVLRRNDTLKKLSDIKQNAYDSSVTIDESHNKVQEYDLRILIRDLMSETPFAGYHPDESYEEGTTKNLMLDKETSHGGWPEGPSKSYTSDDPVNKQIIKWLKTMKMVKK